MRVMLMCALGLLPLLSPRGQTRAKSEAGAGASTPSYTADGRLVPPLKYREWIYLTTGLDMSYTPQAAGMAGHSTFDNVFVNSEAYRSYLDTGMWPDKTMMIIERRGAESNASVNRAGHFQGGG